MKQQKFSMPVASEHFRKLADPQNASHDSYYAYVCVKNLPLNLPLDVNPRNQDTESRVARQIANGLVDDWSIFHLLNRGITVSARDVEYDNKTGLLSLVFPDPSDDYGIIDGGHTYAVIKKNLEPFLQSPQKPDFFDAQVRLEILVNVDADMIVDLARARNTSAQVRDESLANLEGKFNWVKEVVAQTPFADRIAYRENEEDKPLDIRDIIALITLFHPAYASGDNPPILGYSSKGSCLRMFRDEKQQDGYLRLKPIIVDVLRLYDYVQKKFEPLYREVGGITSVGSEGEEKNSDGNGKKKTRLGGVSEVKKIKAGFPLYFYGETAHYRFPDGWIYPVLAAHRAIVSYKGASVSWKVDPFKFFDRYGKSLVGITLEASKASGRNPNAVGKNKNHWIQLHDKVVGGFTELLGVDLDRTVKL
jgi:hypothetical protein